jgi:hypothetical protein
LISKEDVRIVLSYIPFKRDVAPESMSSQNSANQHSSSISVKSNGASNKEGLYEQEEGKVLEYKDRVSD